MQDDSKLDMRKMFLDMLGVKDCVQPDSVQRLIMETISNRSGLAVVQDRGTAYAVMGPHSVASHGCFVYKKFNPHFRSDVVILNSDADSAYWFHVLFHELTHATGTETRLDRIGVNEMQGGLTPIYAMEECIADTVARRLMDYFGMSTNETIYLNEAYIKTYRDHVERLTGLPFPDDALNARVEQAFDFLLENWLQGIFIKKDSSFAA